MELFEYQKPQDADESKPLAERMRPKTISEFAGQGHLTSDGSVLRHAIEHDRIFSMILWGPPGCGKTTLAGIIAQETRSHFIQFSAVLSGVKEIRSVIEEAIRQKSLYKRKTVLFVDEIHRFNKAQQDAFLPHVESGLITLIGATTENPSFEVIAPLLSRCRVMVLHRLSDEAIGSILKRAMTDKGAGFGKQALSLDADACSHLIRIADGDARRALNSLEMAASLALSAKTPGPKSIRLKDVEQALQHPSLMYDKSGEEHYNLISAFHKSLRGSDPDAAIYWLCRMLSSGEDPFYVGRRMVRFASEDVGNADPAALGIALNAVESFRFLGHPEGELALVQAAVYLACAPKSNSLYTAYGDAQETIRQTGSLPVPFHIRNAPSSLMKSIGYGKDYRYAHDYSDGYVVQDYLPESLKDRIFYIPTDRGGEKVIRQRLDKWRELKASASTASNPA